MQTDIIQTIVERVKGLSTEQQAQVLEFVQNLEPHGKTPWKIWQEISKDIPPEEFESIPTDASVNLDHYLYGAPKK
jgi:hypothetical protein